jgi:hypothetical protein
MAKQRRFFNLTGRTVDGSIQSVFVLQNLKSNMKDEVEFCTQVPIEGQSHLDVTISKENNKWV